MEEFLREMASGAAVIGGGIAVAIVLIIALLLFLFAAAGCILPIIPGPILAFLGIVLVKFALVGDKISYTVLEVCLFLTIFAQFLDWWLPIKYTPTKSGAWGAFVGVLVGALAAILFPPIALFAIFFAPLIFAFAFDLLSGGEFEKALHTGFGAFLGTLIAVFAKLFIIFLMLMIACANLIFS